MTQKKTIPSVTVNYASNSYHSKPVEFDRFRKTKG